MVKRLLTEEDVLRLLRKEISQSNITDWARRKALSRSYLSKALCGSRPLTSSIARALGLRRIVRCNASEKEIRTRLQRAIKRAGNISSWSRQTSIDRAVVSLVVNGKRKPSQSFFRALKIRRETLYEPA